MIRYKEQIRLDTKDKRRLARITGVVPGNPCTVAELNRYIDAHLPQYDGESPESRLLRLLLLDEKINPDAQ